MSFRDNLKTELEYQDVQLKELASITGISKNTLGNYLTGHNSIPAADSAVKIAQALGVTVEYLVMGNLARQREKPLSAQIRKIIDGLTKLDDTDINSIQVLVSAMLKRKKTCAEKTAN